MKKKLINNTPNKTCLITGASSGIGKALAIKMAEKGYNLILTARRMDKLKEIKDLLELAYANEILCFYADVRNQKDMQQIIKKGIQKFGNIDIVIANAGYVIKGRFEQLNPEDYQNIFKTNFFGVLNTLYPAYPFLEKSKGLIVIIGSILGEFGMLNRSAYVASKFALNGFYESIRYELKEKNISIQLFQLGFVNTDIRLMNNKGERIKPTEKGSTNHPFSVNPEKIAQFIVKKLVKKGFHKYILPLNARILVFLNWLMPKVFSNFVYKFRDFIRTKIFN